MMGDRKNPRTDFILQSKRDMARQSPAGLKGKRDK